jgi:hypothetical protein
MALIDLGEPSRFEPEDMPLPRLATLFGGRFRQLAPAVAMILLGGLLAGAPPAPHRLPAVHTVGRFSNAATSLLGDIVVDPDERKGQIIAYALDGSGPRWRAPMIQPVLNIQRAGNSVLVALAGSGNPPDAGASEPEPVQPVRSVVAYDARSGAQRWSRQGELVSLLEAPVVVLRTSSSQLAGVEAVTGRELWRRGIAAHGQVVPIAQDTESGYRTDELLLVDADGVVESLRTASGEVRKAGRIPAPASVRIAWKNLLGVQVTGEYGLGEMAFYELGTDRPLRRAKLPLGESGVWACGARVCQGDGNGIRQIDPYTGEVMMTITHDDGSGLPPGTSLYGRWESIGRYRERVLVRLDPASTADGATWLGVVTPGEPAGVRPLMPIGGRANTCWITGEWLFCNGSVVVDAIAVRLTELESLLDGR